MLLPNLTHAELAEAFVDRYRKNFKAIRNHRHAIEVWVKGDDREHFELDVKRYHLHRILRAYLDWIFNQSPEPKPAKLKSHGFLVSVMREAVTLLYEPEGIR